MTEKKEQCDADNTQDLDRFIKAQEAIYLKPLKEINNSRKCSNWMWFIFPQFDGLGFSETSKRYSIKSVAEAKAYLLHPVLSPRLNEMFKATICIESISAYDIFGTPDDMKLQSCATLFAYIYHPDSVFDQLSEKYFQGKVDDSTYRLLEIAS